MSASVSSRMARLVSPLPSLDQLLGLIHVLVRLEEADHRHAIQRLDAQRRFPALLFGSTKLFLRLFDSIEAEQRDCSENSGVGMVGVDLDDSIGVLEGFLVGLA